MLSDLLVSISRVKQTIPNIKLVVAGKGNEIPAYKKEVEMLGILDQVSFEGFVSDDLLPQYYAGANVLVLPSRNQAEGFGMVITEAAACGTPAIATLVGGIPAALIDNVTGLLVEPSNVDELTKKIVKMLSNSEYAEDLGKKAQERSEKEFSLPVVTKKFLAIIDDVIKQSN